jgi:Ca-activated chloride channel family protein
MSVSFEYPALLFAALLLAGAGALWLRRRELVRRADLARFGDSGLLARSSALPTSRRIAMVQGLALVAIVLAVVTLSRPLGGTGIATAHRDAGDVIIVLDLSRSMNAEDVAPSRLGAAKRAAAAIADALPDDRVGLMVFGGVPFLQLPPTLDHSTFRRFLDAAGTDDIPDVGTNIEITSQMAVQLVQRESDLRFAAVTLISDGEDVEGKLEEGVKAFKSANVRVFTVGVGTPQGSTIPERDSTGALTTHHDFAQREVITRLNEDNLKRLAEQSGGRYVRWNGESSLRPITDELTQLHKRGVTSAVHAPEAERFQWPLALAIVALVGETVLVVGGRRRERV